jgi:hypothetical protein
MEKSWWSMLDLALEWSFWEVWVSRLYACFTLFLFFSSCSSCYQSWWTIWFITLCCNDLWSFDVNWKVGAVCPWTLKKSSWTSRTHASLQAFHKVPTSLTGLFSPWKALLTLCTLDTSSSAQATGLCSTMVPVLAR